MKPYFVLTAILSMFFLTRLSAQEANGANTGSPHLYLDVHHLSGGTVSFQDVAAAHAKDLATQEKFGVHFLKYWVDEKNGDIYCLSSAADTSSVLQTHKEAHGLLPQEIYEVTDGSAAVASQTKHYFLDVHNLGAGNVKAAGVERAHQKDLAIQGKYGVNFINYWVSEKKGMVVCLSQADGAEKVIQTHKEAHGLIPASVVEVKEGQ